MWAGNSDVKEKRYISYPINLMSMIGNRRAKLDIVYIKEVNIKPKLGFHSGIHTNAWSKTIC